MRIWLPLLLLALTACAPTVHVVEAPKKPTFDDVDVCTLLKDGDVERQQLVGTTPAGHRACEFAFGNGEGAVSVEVTLLAKPYREANRFCVEGCVAGAQFQTVDGRSMVHKCDEAAGSMRCEGYAQVWERKTVGLVVKRSVDSAEALGRLTDSIAQKLLNQAAVTS